MLWLAVIAAWNASAEPKNGPYTASVTRYTHTHTPLPIRCAVHTCTYAVCLTGRGAYLCGWQRWLTDTAKKECTYWSSHACPAWCRHIPPCELHTVYTSAVNYFLYRQRDLCIHTCRDGVLDPVHEVMRRQTAHAVPHQHHPPPVRAARLLRRGRQRTKPPASQGTEGCDRRTAPPPPWPSARCSRRRDAAERSSPAASRT